MGSKISKALRPHVKTDAAAAPAVSDNHDINEITSRQESTLPSTPSISSLRNDGAATRYVQVRLDNFEQFLVERQMMAIDIEEPNPFTYPAPCPIAQPTPPVPQCLFCCKDLPKDATEVVLTPCRLCRSPCCTACVKNMFVEACRDATRMPPRCCVPFNIHTAKPYLSQEDVALFRVKYEEWCTTNPIYCPVPTCSAFIPDRLLPQHFREKRDSRVDSGIGTPTPDLFTCPTCEAGICIGCQQQAHPGSMCTAEEFGIDTDTAALLKAWGYKRCPKCGHGVKRMFGCCHMECRCGANFCWGCLNMINECEGCRGEDDEDVDDESDSDPVSNGENTATPTNSASEHCISATTDEDATANVDQSEASPQPIRRITNLDGGGSRYWARSSFDFGEEPSGDGSEAAWSCNHNFMPYTVPFETALGPQTANMECVKCWDTIHPSIETTQASAKNKVKPSPRAGTNGVQRRQTARRGRPFGSGRGAYMPPRGLQRGNATIGTAPHLSTTIPPESPTPTRRQVSPMDSMQVSERDTDPYDNVTTTPSLQIAQPASCHPPTSVHDPRKALKEKSTSVFATSPPPSSLAHECRYCYALVCRPCKDAIAAAQDAKQKREIAANGSEHISDGAEQQAAVVTTEQDVAVATGVEAILEEGEDEDMQYSLFD
ncbi:hypothetical protein DE146DRAFT_692591 [Phaeosphaeria sp. MPI-PUGE-AT-0046c]|nr:hypothetical protein DE146DRAFT_692591 [Phaeosphaeria sp. MPI-PUGE-AT-0046c]